MIGTDGEGDTRNSALLVWLENDDDDDDDDDEMSLSCLPFCLFNVTVSLDLLMLILYLDDTTKYLT